jgi:hypothetical protein
MMNFMSDGCATPLKASLLLETVKKTAWMPKVGYRWQPARLQAGGGAFTLAAAALEDEDGWFEEEQSVLLVAVWGPRCEKLPETEPGSNQEFAAGPSSWSRLCEKYISRIGSLKAFTKNQKVLWNLWQLRKRSKCGMFLPDGPLSRGPLGSVVDWSEIQENAAAVLSGAVVSVVVKFPVEVA